jgi:hypothetical protein
LLCSRCFSDAATSASSVVFLLCRSQRRRHGQVYFVDRARQLHGALHPLHTTAIPISPHHSPQTESACLQAGVARSTLYRWQAPSAFAAAPSAFAAAPLSICSSARSHRFTGYSAHVSQAHLSNSKAFSQQVCFTSIFYAFHKSQPKVSSKRSPPHPSSAAVSAAKEANRAASSVLLPAPLSGKLSTGRLVTICELLKDGKNTIENACAVAGVGRTSLYDNGSCRWWPPCWCCLCSA